MKLFEVTTHSGDCLTVEADDSELNGIFVKFFVKGDLVAAFPYGTVRSIVQLVPKVAKEAL